MSGGRKLTGCVGRCGPLYRERECSEFKHNQGFTRSSVWLKILRNLTAICETKYLRTSMMKLKFPEIFMRLSARWQAASILFSLSVPFSASAQSIMDALTAVLESSPRTAAARSDHASAQARLLETERRLWRPVVDLTAEKGIQKFETEAIQTGSKDVDRTVLRATQLLYDFDRSSRQVEEVAAVVAQAGAVSDATRDGLLLEALTAHWSSVRARLVLDYAKKSEASVLNLTQIENSLVELGRGYESNVLQAKVQLASAEARRIRAEGALDIADARVAAVFGRIAPQVTFSHVAGPVQARLPSSLEDARSLALAQNKQIKIGQHRSKALTERLAFVTAKEFRPKIDLVAEVGQRRNWDSPLEGAKVDDQKLLVQFNWNVNAGMAGRASQEAVRNDLAASIAREAEARDLILEQVSIAWRNLLVARQNKLTLANQVRIAAQFFEMATAERQMGRRSLLDVLTAEVSLINAMSDLVATEVDQSIAGLTLMQAIGVLSLDSVRPQAVVEAIPAVGAR
jgi:adhesin transport system outer membrane protein